LEPAQARAGVQTKVALVPASRKRVRTYQALPFGAARGWAPLSWDANDLETQTQGLAKRLLRELPKACEGFYDDFATFVDSWLDANIKPVEVPTFDEWLLSTPYAEARRAELTEWYVRFHGRCPPRRYRRRIDSFIKREFYLEWKAPRWINSRHDAFKAWSGRFFSAVEKALFSLPYFAKHMTVEQRIQAIFALECAGMTYYENDFKAFESHFVRLLMLACECRLYKKALAKYPEEARQICQTLTGVNQLRTRAGVKVAVEATRMSGDMCTSLGNGFTNLMLVLYIVSRKGFDYHGVRALVEGDDGLFAVPCSLTQEDYASCGFTVEINQISRPHLGHFCGATLSDDGCLLKDPHKVLCGFGWTDLVGCGAEVAMELLRAKAMSLAHEAPQCPIVGALARKALNLTDGYEPRWTDKWKQKEVAGAALCEFAPTAVTRASFAERTGIPVTTQLEVENLIERGLMNDIHLLLSPPRAVEQFASRYVEVAG
jgi:hypothetical protein